MTTREKTRELAFTLSHATFVAPMSKNCLEQKRKLYANAKNAKAKL